MHIAKTDVPVKTRAPGAVARHKGDFGDASRCGRMAGEYFSFAAGTDIAPLLKGLEDDLCQAPHWGYLLEGEVIVSYATGEDETVRGGDLFYWPPGHTVKATADAEMILFSPEQEHRRVLEHVSRQLGS